MPFYIEKQFSIISKDFYRSEIRIRELALRKIVVIGVKHAACLRLCEFVACSLSQRFFSQGSTAVTFFANFFVWQTKKLVGFGAKPHISTNYRDYSNIFDNFKMVD